MIWCTFSQSFTLVYDSDPGDFIWKWQYRSFDDSVDFISTRKSYDNDDSAWYQFDIEGFDINTDLSFEPGSKVFAPWMYYPAKRFPFNWKFNWIDINADHSWCNKALWWFYVHEFSANKEEVLLAAIDFVQFCEWSPSWLYGSLRFNSSVPNSCNTTWCPKVRERFNPAGDDAQIKVDHVSLDTIVKKLEAIEEKVKNEYNFFYTECIEPIEQWTSEVLVEEYGSTYFNVNACQWKYTNIFSLVNNLLNKFIGNRTQWWWDTLLDDNLKKEAIQLSQKMITKIEGARTRLSNAWTLTAELEIALSSIAFILEMWVFWLEIS